MAFRPAPTAAANTTADTSWKADGFLNLYLPTKGGGRRKLGTIALKKSRTSEAELLAWLEEDPSRVAKVLDSLIIDFQTAEPKEGSSFDLS